jgi:TPR repeat protein
VGQHAGSQQQQQQQQQQATGGTQPPSTSSRDSLLSEAVDWYRKGLALGDPQSAAHLGYLLEQGVGVPQPDLPAAAEAYRRAAAGGVATAANNLATMYMRGRGVPKVRCLLIYWSLDIHTPWSCSARPCCLHCIFFHSEEYN